jgi:hypothetical protein
VVHVVTERQCSGLITRGLEEPATDAPMQHQQYFETEAKALPHLLIKKKLLDF